MNSLEHKPECEAPDLRTRITAHRTVTVCLRCGALTSEERPSPWRNPTPKDAA